MARKKQPAVPPVVWIILVLLVLGLVWYIQQAPPAAPPEKNITAPAEQGVARGDIVAINFVLSLTNGSVVDTNNASLAQEYNITNYVKGPFRFVVGESGKLKGFDEAVLGMRPGEKATKVIQPSEPILQFTINRTRSISRNQPIARFQPMSFRIFEKFFKRKPVINDVAVSAELPWPVKVVNITENHVVTEPVVEEGKSYQLPGLEWKSTLLVKTFNDLVFRHNPEHGQVISTAFGPAVVSVGPGRLNITYMPELDAIVTYDVPLQGPATLPQSFRVINITSADFTIQRVNYLPQESLVITIELLEWEQDVQGISSPMPAPAQ